MTLTTHEHGLDLEGIARRREAGLATLRAPWRSVVGVVKLRRGWAIFLACPSPGHIAFLNALDSRWRAYPGALTLPPGCEAPAGVGPKKMRCATCAGAERPHHIDRNRPSQEDIRRVLAGREDELSPRALAAANRHIDRANEVFLERVRTHGVSAMKHAVAHACATRVAGRRP